MCTFTYTHLECGHRNRDHVDTNNCRYFARIDLHCQPDNPQHIERGTTVVTRKKDGLCDKCIREAQEEREIAALMREQREAAKAKQAEAEAYSKQQATREEKLRKARRRETARLIQEKLDREEAERLQKEEYDRVEQEAKVEKEFQIRQERMRREDKDARRETYAAAERRRKADEEEHERKQEEQAKKERVAARRKKEKTDLQEKLAKEEEIWQQRKYQERAELEAAQQAREEAEHQDELRRIEEEAARKRRQREDEDEAEHLQKEQAKGVRNAFKAANKGKRRDEETELNRYYKDGIERQERAVEEERERLARWQSDHAATEPWHKEQFERNEILRKGVHAREERKNQDRGADYTRNIAQDKAHPEARDRERKELEHKLAQQRTASEAKAVSATPGDLLPHAPKPPIEYNKMVGHVGAPEIGPYTLGNGRRAPLHESQKVPTQSNSPATPSLSFKPALSPMARLGGTVYSSPTDWKVQQPNVTSTPSTPDWKKNGHSRRGSRNIPPDEEPAMDPVLQRRLDAQRRKCEEEDATKAAMNGNATSEATQISTSTVPSLSNPNATAIPANPKSFQPQVPIRLTPPPLTRPKPALKPKPNNTGPVPTMPALRLPTRIRVDSAAGEGLAVSKEYDDESAWEESDRYTMRAQRLSQAEFDKQRRIGWAGDQP